MSGGLKMYGCDGNEYWYGVIDYGSKWRSCGTLLCFVMSVLFVGGWCGDGQSGE